MVGHGLGVALTCAWRRKNSPAGGATVSRTDVLAETVVPTRHRKRAAALLADAVAPLLSSL